MIALLIYLLRIAIVLTVTPTVPFSLPSDIVDDYEPGQTIAAQRLQRYLHQRRGPDIVKPRRNSSTPVVVKFKMELYQIIELNERQQYVAVSVWVIERWYDDLLYWNPTDFDNITETKMHHSHLWIPDTTLYNTLVMKDDDQRRLLNVKVTTDWERKRALIEFLYPAIYKFYCRLYLQFFPFDSQTCHMIFGSWTSDNRDIDYISLAQEIGTSNYMPNEGWSIMGTSAQRVEVKYVCCEYNYTLLDFTLYLRRRPLFYLVNLVIPTFIITLIAITGFFTTSSTTGVREEKISLCITTLLSMSILMLMVSDQMPSTSTFIPLISWFYMCAIVIISVGALAASFVISVQKFGSLGQRLPRRAVTITRIFSIISLTRVPDHLQPKDKLLEKLSLREQKSMEASSRKSTISQFAKYIFTAGTEIPGFYEESVWRQQVLDALLSRPVQGRVPPSYGALRKNGVGPERGYPTTNGCPPCENAVRRKDARGHVHYMEETAGLNRNNSVDTNDYKKGRNHSTTSEVFEDEKTSSTRRLARIEYDWLATVMERCTFLVFLFTFLFISLGINFVGVVHWLNSTPPPEVTLVTTAQ